MPILTNAQIERAAREYCRIRGINPDEDVTHGPDTDGYSSVCDVCLISKRWERVAVKIREHNLLSDVIKDVAFYDFALSTLALSAPPQSATIAAGERSRDEHDEKAETEGVG